jgi:hypothetical protein
MWEPQRLTTLWAFTVCYRDSFTFTFKTHNVTSAATYLTETEKILDGIALFLSLHIYDYLQILCLPIILFFFKHLPIYIPKHNVSETGFCLQRWIMSRNIIFVTMCHRHKLLDLNYDYLPRVFSIICHL